MQYEWEILPGITEVDQRGRQKCNLFGGDFLKALKQKYLQLSFVLENHSNWSKELAELRDPAAHRIPLYVPSSVIASQEQIDKFRRIEAQADVNPSGRGDRPISEIYCEARAVADFAPVMIMSTPQGFEMRSIDEQLQRDHDTYLKIAEAVVEAL
jgi:hypothetical protein